MSEQTLDIKNLSLLQSVNQEDRILMTDAARDHCASAMKIETFRKEVLEPHSCEYSGYVNVDYSHTARTEQTTGIFKDYVGSPNYDAVKLDIYLDSGKLEVVNAQATYFFFFSSKDFAPENFIRLNTSGTIPEGARFCIIDFLKSANTQGYANMRIRQDGSAVDRLELSQTNARIDDVYSKLNEIAGESVRIEDFIHVFKDKNGTVLGGINQEGAWVLDKIEGNTISNLYSLLDSLTQRIQANTETLNQIVSQLASK